MGDFVHFIEFLYKFSIPLYHLYKAPFAFSYFLPSPFTLIVYQVFTVKQPLFCLHTPFTSYHRPSNRTLYTYFSTALFILLSACRHTSEDLYPNVNPSHGLHNPCLKSHNP